MKPVVFIFTDGSAYQGAGGWAALIIDQQQQCQELSGSAVDTSANRMELTAAAEALDSLVVPCVVDLFTDSTYLFNHMTQCMPIWIKLRRAPDVPNWDLWEVLARQYRRHTIRWHHVRGHAGNPYNEYVDQMAKNARRKRK